MTYLDCLGFCKQQLFGEVDETFDVQFSSIQGDPTANEGVPIWCTLWAKISTLIVRTLQAKSYIPAAAVTGCKGKQETLYVPDAKYCEGSESPVHSGSLIVSSAVRSQVRAANLGESASPRCKLPELNLWRNPRSGNSSDVQFRPSRR